VQLRAFLGFDRCTFSEFTADGWVNVLCSVAVEGMEPYPRGPLTASFGWFVEQARAGKIVAVRTLDDLPPEAVGEAEHFRRSGLRSYLRIPVGVGGRIVGSISFSAVHSTQAWPDDLIARLKIVGEVIAQALIRKRSEEALHASEARWRSVFESSILGISLTDQNLRFLAANAAFLGMLGYTEKELRQLSALDLSFDEDRGVSAARLLELQRGERQHYDIVKQYRRKDGAPVWAHSYVSTMAVGESQPPVFLATTIDMTDRKRAEDALHRTQSDLARVSRLTTMGEMTASIAHEVNQPLAAIVANGNAGLRWLASKTPDLDEVHASLKRIISDGHRASEVIGSIRAMFKKEDHGKTRLDINELVHEILALVQGELQINRISVQTDLAPDLPEVLGDRIQLQQVILNLIMNAIEAMISVEGRARALRVSSEQRGPDGVLMSVADSGTGIDSKTIDRIFEPLYTTKPDGMGMGLSICRSIIQAHRGQLSASAGHPHGSVFQVVLPTAQFAE
jgi:PAS domain S-box-containing protein